MKGKVSFAFGILGLTLSYFLTSDGINGTIFKVAFGLVVGGLIEFIVFILENKRKWGVLKTLFFKRSKPVRVTMAYLFRIEINGRYLLIKRHKKDKVGYQPVGGAYKFLKEENRGLFDKLGVEPCHYVPRDEDTDNDLRVIVNQRKNLTKFLKWFDSRLNRELDPRREFYEELVEPGLLSVDLFRNIQYVYVGKHVEGVLKSPVYPIDELRYADIFELRLENDAQRNAIKSLQNSSDEIIFVTPDEAKTKSSSTGLVILPHSFKILPNDNT